MIQQAETVVTSSNSLINSPAFWVFAGLLVTQIVSLINQRSTAKDIRLARESDLKEARDARAAAAQEAKETSEEQRLAAERAREAATSAAVAATGAGEAAKAAATEAIEARKTAEKVQVQTDKIEVLVNNKSDVAQATIEKLTEEVKRLNDQALKKAESEPAVSVDKSTTAAPLPVTIEGATKTI